MITVNLDITPKGRNKEETPKYNLAISSVKSPMHHQTLNTPLYQQGIDDSWRANGFPYMPN